MSIQSIQVADKGTLDSVKGMLENESSGLNALKLLLSNISENNGGKTYIDPEVNMYNNAGIVADRPGFIPYSFYAGCAVVYRGEVHLLGSAVSEYCTYHYKWDGLTWKPVSMIPYNFYNGSAVVYNDEIHILGSSNSSYYKYHYKWNGSEWESVGTLPYNFYNGSAVVYNDEIHILGSSNSSYYKYHYKWNGNTWIGQDNELPYNFYYGSAVVYNDEIHILGGNGGTKSHYKWNGSEWESVGTLPYIFYYGSAVVYNDEIHILGSSHSSYYRSHYKYDGSSWTPLASLEYDFFCGSTVVYMDRLIQFGGNSGSSYIISFSNNTYSRYDFNTYNMDAVVFNGELHAIHINGYHCKMDNVHGSWIKLGTVPYYGSSRMTIYNDEIHLLQNTYHYKWNGDEWVSVSTLPCAMNSGSSVVFEYGGYLHVTYEKCHYLWNGSSWRTLPCVIASFGSRPSVVKLKDGIHVISSMSHYKFDGSWTQLPGLDSITDASGSCAVLYDDEIHLLGGRSSYYKSHYKWNGSTWIKLQNLPYDFNNGAAAVVDDEIHILGGSGYGSKHYVLYQKKLC